MHSAANPFKILTSVDSTNNYAMGMIRDGIAKHGEAWFSYEQTHGKGRRGKTWKADKGKNIILSIAAETGFLTLSQQFHLSIVVALGCLSFFKKYAGNECKIKWPNDIFWNDRKAGGILIENIIKGSNWQWSVIGIGININQAEFSNDAGFKPVSLKQITGKDFDIVELAKELYGEIMVRFENLKNNGIEKMFEEFNKNLFGLDKKVKLKKENAVFETTIKGVSPQGKLMTVDTLERQFDIDGVEWVKEQRVE